MDTKPNKEKHMIPYGFSCSPVMAERIKSQVKGKDLTASQFIRRCVTREFKRIERMERD